MEAQEYYNVDIAYFNQQPGKENILEGEHLIVVTDNEIKLYLDYIRQGKFGKQPIGNKKLNVVTPEAIDSIRIFDFSKITLLPNRTKHDFENETNKKVKATNDYLKAFLELGKEVTDSFGINLEDLLGLTLTNITTPENESDQIEDHGKEVSEITTLTSGKSSVFENLTGKILPIFPKEFSDGIIDNSIEPAFQVEKVAKVFGEHLKNLIDESGQMIGVFGQWGRGKSYFTNEVFKQLGLFPDKILTISFFKQPWSKIQNIFKKKERQEKPSFYLIKFQAWKYQNTPSIWAYLFETFVDEFLKVNWYKKIFRLIRLSIARHGHWKTWIWPAIGFIIGIFAVSFTPALGKADNIEIIIKIAGIAGTLAISFEKGSSILKKFKKPATTIFNSISKVPSFKAVLGVQAEIQKELKNLIKAWSKIIKKKRILLLIDDLDRCSEEQIIEIIDSLRVMLDDDQIKRHVLILVALDEEKLKRAIKTKYEKLYEKNELTGVVNEYLDKLFISAIKLFPISFDDRSEFIKKLASQINSEEVPDQNKDMKPKELFTPTPDLIKSTGVKMDSQQENKPTPTSFPASTPVPEIQKSRKNLEESEVTMLQEKIKLASNELTPRQIRILIYRYLLARNLWISFYNILDWRAENAIDEIMRFSDLNGLDPKAQTTINGDLSKIARMVVAY